MNAVRRVPAAAVLCMAALAAACTGDTPLQPAALPAGGGVERLVALGFARSDIVDAGDRYVVEGDIVFRKADLEGGPRFQAAGAGPRGQYQTVSPYTLSPSKMALGVTVNLTQIAGNSAWLAATRSAMAEWRALYGNTVWFSEVTTGGDITVKFGTTGSGHIAEGWYPVNGLPGYQVVISSGAAGSYTSSAKKLVMVHELGHTMGLRHTNMYLLGETIGAAGVSQIPGTPGSENGSVMNTYVGSLSWNGFTTNDIRAVNYMFLAPSPVFTAQGYDAADHPVITWNAVADAAYYRVSEQYMALDWVYDPFYQPDGGYWANTWFAGYVGSTTGTTFTVTSRTRSYDDSCGLFFYVEPVYPSGKVGKSTLGSMTYDAC